VTRKQDYARERRERQHHKRDTLIEAATVATLRDVDALSRGRKLTAQEVIEIAARHFKVTILIIKGPSRRNTWARPYVPARRIAMLLTYIYTRATIGRIAVAFRKDHTTFLCCRDAHLADLLELFLQHHAEAMERVNDGLRFRYEMNKKAQARLRRRRDMPVILTEATVAA